MRRKTETQRLRDQLAAMTDERDENVRLVERWRAKHAELEAELANRKREFDVAGQVAEMWVRRAGEMQAHTVLALVNRLIEAERTKWPSASFALAAPDTSR